MTVRVHRIDGFDDYSNGARWEFQNQFLHVKNGEGKIIAVYHANQWASVAYAEEQDSVDR